MKRVNRIKSVIGIVEEGLKYLRNQNHGPKHSDASIMMFKNSEGVEYMEFYTCDGKGNGDHLFSVPVVDVKKAAIRNLLRAKRHV